MSYLSYMTNHYQNAINDHAKATKATKYIQHYTYNKSSSKYENTENESSIRSQENILFCEPQKYLE